MKQTIIITMLLLGLFFQTAHAQIAPAPSKEWTVLVYVNGNNSLADEVQTTLNQMETVGSDQNINIVVQSANKDVDNTLRYLIQKDGDINTVTSPVVQTLPRLDMGDSNTLVSFAQWGVQNYPAKKYMLIVWAHGTGWHALPKKDEPDPTSTPTPPGTVTTPPAPKFVASLLTQIKPRDISTDDLANDRMTTPQVGDAMRQIAGIIGRPLDVFGGDVCSGASIEITAEMQDSVRYVVNSEELEDGWNYANLFAGLAQNPTADPLAAGKILVDTYYATYAATPTFGDMGGVTMSVTDTQQLPQLEALIGQLAKQIQTLDKNGLYQAFCAADISQRFWYDEDYRDIGSFAQNLKVAMGELDPGAPTLDSGLLDQLTAAVKLAVPYVRSSPKYTNATGLTMWVPGFDLIYNRFSADYATLKFQGYTDWNSAAKLLVRPDYGPY